MINVYSQLALNRVSPTQSGEIPYEQSQGFSEKKKLLLWIDSNFNPCQRAPACPSWWPAPWISDLPIRPSQLDKPIPCNKSLNIYPLLVLFLWWNSTGGLGKLPVPGEERMNQGDDRTILVSGYSLYSSQCAKTLITFNPLSIICHKYYYYPYFIDEATEAQKS